MLTTPLRHSWLALLLMALLSNPLPAAIVQTGNVSPDVHTWTNLTSGRIGDTSTGSMTVNAGSSLASYSGSLGYNSGSTGTATVTGTGSKWTSGFELFVGRSGNGTLTIEAGGLVSSSAGLLGYNAGSTGTATVTGTGSEWDSRFELLVGRSGNGTLTIEAGGQVSTYFGHLGHHSGSTGTAMVTGAGSKWTNSSSLIVGGSGNGTLTIDAGGQVSSSFGRLGASSGSTGTVTVTGTGSKWTNDFYFHVGYFGSGTLTIEAGGLVSFGGMLTIDYSSLGTSFINMTTGGMLALYGDADDSLAQFLGLVQGTDAIRFWDGSLSDWSPLTSATLGVDYALEYLTTGDLAGYTLLTVGEITGPGPGSQFPGDFNNDGQVDAADYTVWRNHLGGSEAVLSGNGSGNGIVDVADYDIWKNHFGTTSLSGSLGATPVPEPSTGLLVICAAAGIVSLRRRTGRSLVA